MKTQYVTNDGKIFVSKEAAEEYESRIKKADENKAKMKEEIKKLEDKIDKLESEKNACIDQYIELSTKYIETYGTEEQIEVLEKLKIIKDYFM